MIVGFTGTLQGPTSQQNDAMRKLFRKLAISRFVHGGAPGCDTIAHYAVRRRHPNILIEIHPGPFSGSTVWLPMGNCEIYPELPSLERDRVIVGRIQGLVAIPRTDREELGSGTWSTVRYAREIGCPIYIIRKNGQIRRDVVEL